MLGREKRKGSQQDGKRAGSYIGFFENCELAAVEFCLQEQAEKVEYSWGVYSG